MARNKWLVDATIHLKLLEACSKICEDLHEGTFGPEANPNDPKNLPGSFRIIVDGRTFRIEARELSKDEL